MKNVEGLNDPDGDRVEYTSGPEGVCVTVIWQETDWGSRQEITVGPFPADRLHWALDQVAEPETLAGFKETLDRLQAEILREATGGLMDGGVTSAAVEKEAASAPAGSYTRTESPDYADGGVTAAAIEKETEQARPFAAADIEQLVTQNRYRVADAIRALYPEEPMATGVLAHTVMTALTEPSRPAWADLADTLRAIDPAETLSIDDLAEAAHEHGVRVASVGLTPTNPEKEQS